jgi:hypothetical protein
MKDNFIIGYQTVRRLGQWLMNNKLSDPMQRNWLWHSCYSDTARIQHENQLQNTENLTQFIIKCLPGCKVVRGSTLRGKPETAFTYEHKGVERDIISITWLAPGALEAWNTANYIQLDCSFQGAWPFVYCVPQAIIRNEAVPLGFIMTPSECHLTYDWFCTDLANSDPTKKVKLKKQIILSDEGSGLKRFCRRSSFGAPLLHFYCHRHLIQAFGASGLLGQLVKQALATQSKAIYMALRPQLLRTAWVARHEKRITRKAYNLFCQFCSARFPHGIWHRAQFRVARCSNHAERFHGVINKRIKGCRQLTRKLYQIYLYIIEKRKHYGDLSQLKRNFDRLRSYGEAGSKTCDLAECVAFRANMALRFGLSDFPCRHTVQTWRVYIRSHTIPPLPALPSCACARNVDLLEHSLTAIQTKAQSSKRFKRRIKFAIRPRSDTLDEDEANPRPVKKVQWTAEDFEGYFTARRVVMGAKALIDKRRREEGDIVCLAFWILKGWNKGLKALIQQKRSDAEQQNWVAGFTIMWWNWAEKGDLHKRPGDFPVDNLLCAHVEASDDEDTSGDDDLPGVGIVPEDDGLVEDGDLPSECQLYESTDVSDASEAPPHTDVNPGAATGDAGTWAGKVLSTNPLLQRHEDDIGENFVTGPRSESESDDEVDGDNDAIQVLPACLRPDGTAAVQEIAHEPDAPVPAAPLADESITQSNPPARRNPRREMGRTSPRESPGDRPAKGSPRPYKPRGFRNFGLTCFVNACLQALFSVSRFRSFLSDPRTRRLLKKPGPPSRDLAIVCSALFHCNDRALCQRELSDLPGYVPSGGPVEFDDGTAHDAAGFMLSLLEQLDLDFDPIIVASGRVGFNPFRRPKDTLRDDGGQSIIAHLFAGEYLQRTVCAVGHVSDLATEFVTLSLPCPEQTKAIDLEGLLLPFFRPAVLDKNNLYFCTGCGRKVESHTSSRFSVAPPVLIFHIRRMDYQANQANPAGAGRGARTSTAVRVPLVLTMDSELLEDQFVHPVTYRLLFCVDHQGTLEGGHFITHLRSGSTWHTCNDKKVTSDTDLPYGGFPSTLVYLVGCERSDDE